jgi:hypothetical protein
MSKARKSIKLVRKVFHASGTPVSAISWPATSSMTTDCGSFLPHARETRVAAGTPMPAAKAASAKAVAARELGGKLCETAAHARTAAADPQVPGPGFSRPTPKKVAMTLAQSGAPPVVNEVCCKSPVCILTSSAAVPSGRCADALRARPSRFAMRMRSQKLIHGLSSGSSGVLSRMPSSASVTGDETT